MKIFLLLLAVVACVMLYRWQTQPKPVAEVTTPVPVATPKATPRATPKTAISNPAVKTGHGKPQPLTNSADVQKELGLQGTSLDRPPRK
jgi:hypothetical protein